MSAVIRFLADEDFDNDILRGALLRLPDLDVVRVQDVGLLGKYDSCHCSSVAHRQRKGEIVGISPYEREVAANSSHTLLP